MIDRISGRVALLVIVIAALLVLLIGWFALISPERSKASKLGTQISSTDAQLASVQAFLHGPTRKQNARELPILKRALPDTPQMSAVLRELSNLSSSAGVAVTGITPGSVAMTGGAEALPLSITVSGHYFALQGFLRDLRQRAYLQKSQPHSVGRLYTVDSIQFGGGQTTGPSGQTSGSSVIQASVALNAFVYGGTPVVTTPGATTTTTTTTTTSG